MAPQVDTAPIAMSAHVETIEKRLGYWEAELDRRSYEAAAARVWNDETPVLDMRLVHLRNSFDHARGRLSLLQAAGEEKWEAFRADVEFAVREFEKALREGR